MASELTKAWTGAGKVRQERSARSKGRVSKRSPWAAQVTRPAPAWRGEVHGEDAGAGEALQQRRREQTLAAAEVHQPLRRGPDQVEDGRDLFLALGHEEAAAVDELPAVVLAPAGWAVHGL